MKNCNFFTINTKIRKRFELVSVKIKHLSKLQNFIHKQESNYYHVHSLDQGCNGRKVISEVYASFVLQFDVSGREGKHKTDVTA